jgi:hypothetical protein
MMRAGIRPLRFAILLIAGILLAPSVAAQAAAGDPHLARALELRGEALAAYDAGDYDSAAELARRAKAELALIAEEQPPAIAQVAPVEAPVADQAPLPAFYSVRLLPEDRDSLSKIAGYPFIYGDRSKWVVLYRANKKTLKHPENADIILPYELLIIPSISGETRVGEYDASKEYSAFEIE